MSAFAEPQLAGPEAHLCINTVASGYFPAINTPPLERLISGGAAEGGRTRRAPREPHRCWQEYQEERERGDAEVMGGLVDRHNQQHFKRTQKYPVHYPKVAAKLLGNRVVLMEDLANGLEKQPIPVVAYGSTEQELIDIRKLLPKFTYQAVRGPRCVCVGSCVVRVGSPALRLGTRWSLPGIWPQGYNPRNRF